MSWKAEMPSSSSFISKISIGYGMRVEEFSETGADGATLQKFSPLTLAMTLRHYTNPAYWGSVTLGEWTVGRKVLGSPYLNL